MIHLRNVGNKSSYIVFDEPVYLIDFGSLKNNLIYSGLEKFTNSEIWSKENGKDISLGELKRFSESYMVNDTLKSCGKRKRYIQITFPYIISPIKRLESLSTPPIGQWRILDKNQKRNTIESGKNFELRVFKTKERAIINKLIKGIDLSWNLRQSTEYYYASDQVLLDRAELLVTLWVCNSLYK